MIIDRGFEGLKELGTKNVALDEIIGQAAEMQTKWKDDIITGNTVFPLTMREDATLEYVNHLGENVRLDMTDNAFAQVCNRVGIPAHYARKCFDTGRGDLAVENFRSFSRDLTDEPTVVRSRVYDGVAHAVLTSRYQPFDHPEILDGIHEAVGQDGRYEANEAFLSPDRMHVRFVDFNNPLKVNGDTLFSGFTVGSSNIGTGAFAIKYFLYRFACRNGIVRVQNGGMLFRQTHLKDFLESPKDLFTKAIQQMHVLDDLSTFQIGKAMDRKLSAEELSFYLDKAQRELRLGKAGREEVADLIGSSYDPTYYGFLNAVNDSSIVSKYTLDTRIERETWVGDMLNA